MPDDHSRAGRVDVRSRALFFHKIAVLTSAADKSLPGSVMHVPAGFAPRNAIFAPQPFVFADYSDPTSDAMQTQRLAAGVRPAGREFAPGSRLKLGYPPA